MTEFERFLRGWAIDSLVAHSGGSVRKFEGRMLDEISEAVERAEGKAQHTQYCDCRECEVDRG